MSNTLFARLLTADAAVLWLQQVLVMDLHDEIRTRGTSKVQQLLTTPDGIDTCSVLPM
jgi:hypothetical protein